MTGHPGDRFWVLSEKSRPRIPVFSGVNTQTFQTFFLRIFRFFVGPGCWGAPLFSVPPRFGPPVGRVLPPRGKYFFPLFFDPPKKPGKCLFRPFFYVNFRTFPKSGQTDFPEFRNSQNWHFPRFRQISRPDPRPDPRPVPDLSQTCPKPATDRISPVLASQTCPTADFPSFP